MKDLQNLLILTLIMVGLRNEIGTRYPISVGNFPIVVALATVSPAKETKTWVPAKARTIKDMEFNKGIQLTSMRRKELVAYLKNKGFRTKGLTRSHLVRMALAYEYEPFLIDMHHRTGFPVSVIYAYFIFEATYQNKESVLLRKHYNPGGIKYRGKGKIVLAHDDCYSKGKKVPCKFESLSSYQEMVKVWAAVFNHKRYYKCKTYSNVKDICKCLYKKGYHTGNSWERRAGVARNYWHYRKRFPQKKN